ncbi:hypothetical protein IFM89_038947 [Coptis chinensis]|uniref:Reverse transcriptase zinc-binding domain-containing protein n=1 Tax=Coptis chinensis TaxID=261450 RepID=A0A835HJM7_9MAGN|nr:hypothetical protein IFM89_038947 [Coptis chinensis]
MQQQAQEASTSKEPAEIIHIDPETATTIEQEQQMAGLSDRHRGLVGEPNQAREVPETEQEQQITEANVIGTGALGVAKHNQAEPFKDQVRVVQSPILEGDARSEMEVHATPQDEIVQPDAHLENVVECIQPTEDDMAESKEDGALVQNNNNSKTREEGLKEEVQFLLDEHGIDLHSLEKPNSSAADERVWTPELRGNFIVKSAFVEIRSTLATTCWSRVVWKNSIHPQLSAIAWKLFHNEDLDHLLWNCAFAHDLWKWIADKFQVGATFASFTEAINMGTCISPRLRDLWLSAVLGGAVGLWKHRNKVFMKNFRATSGSASLSSPHRC